MFFLILATIILLCSLLLTGFMALSTVGLLLGRPPYVPTPQRIARLMVQAAKLLPHERVYDLGSGDGRLLLASLKQADVIVTGIEGNSFLVLLGRFRLWLMGKKGTILWKNIFAHNYSDADVVFCYLFPSVMKKLQEKFKKELKKGTRVVSYCFPLPEWKPGKTFQTQEKKPNNFLIYLYQA